MRDIEFNALKCVRWIAIGVTLLLVAACELGGAPQASPAPAGPPAVLVAAPIVKEVVVWDEYTARLEAVESVEIRARVSGYLESIAFREGSVVAEGDLLFEIDARPFAAELKRLEAEVQEAIAREQNTIAELRRAERLQAENLMSEEELHDRRTDRLVAAADVQSAEAAVEIARLNLEFTRIHAPMSGRIGRRLVTEGNLILGGAGDATLLTTIVSLDPLHAYFEASERAYLKYLRLSSSGERPSSRDARNPVYLRLADEQGFPHRGYMDFVDNRLDPNTGTMSGRALIPNPSGVLTPGLFARLRLPGSGLQKVLLVPDAAIGSDQTEKFVYVVDENNAIDYRKIKTGPMSHGLRVVSDGLQPGEKIVISGLQRVYPGTTVAPEPGNIEEAPEPLGPKDALPVIVPALSLHTR